jgi:hypothetical protein
VRVAGLARHPKEDTIPETDEQLLEDFEAPVIENIAFECGDHVVYPASRRRQGPQEGAAQDVR